MSIVKTLEMLGQDPSKSGKDLTAAQRQQIADLKTQAAFVNANMIIDEPDSPDDQPEPDNTPDR